MLIDLSGPSQPPAAGGRPRQLVLLLHGLGADGRDLLGLAPLWAQILPEAEFIAPNAPFPCDMGPYGYQWFSLQERDPASLLAGARAAAPILDGFIDEALRARGLGEESLALVGFSQGTMMSLQVGLRRARPVAGILGFSGALIGAETLGEELRSQPPVLLIHGTADSVVPFAAMGMAEAALQAAGVPVTAIPRPGLDHGIDEEGLKAGAMFLREIFSG